MVLLIRYLRGKYSQYWPKTLSRYKTYDDMFYHNTTYFHLISLNNGIIVRFTLNSSTRIIEFRGFLSQFSTNFHEILHTLFSIHVLTTLKISRSFDE